MRLERLVAPIARSMPDAIAVAGTDETLTYAELDALANRFAHALARAGVARGDRVAVHIVRCARAIAAMLGVSRAGGVVVPIDPDSSPARVYRIAVDADVRHVVLAPSHFRAWVSAGFRGSVEHFHFTSDRDAPNVVGAGIHAWSETLAESDESVTSSDGSEDDLAYLLYVSGSRGAPKGVTVSHRSALTLAEWCANLVDLAPGDRVASVAAFRFDLALFEIWASLLRGATVVIVDDSAVAERRRTLDRIHDLGIDVWCSLPCAFVRMLGELDERGAPSMRHVLLPGELLASSDLRRAMAAMPTTRFHHVFGPTERCIRLARSLVAAGGDAEASIPIGVPVRAEPASTLEDGREGTPDDGTWEGFVGGPTVTLGAWNAGAPERLQHPYATGDFVFRSSCDDLVAQAPTLAAALDEVA